MDEWDCIPAPQWSDFQSPTSVETYFDTLQDETLNDFNNTITNEKNGHEKRPLSTLTSNEIEFIGEIDKVKMTPIRIVSPNNKNKENMVKETTYEDFLAKAINDIQLNSAYRSAKKRVYQTPTKSDASDDKYFTPNEKFLTPEAVTKSLVKMIKMKNMSVKNLESEFQETNKNDVKLDKSLVKVEEKTKSSINTSKKDILKVEEIKLEEFLPSKLITNKFTLKDSKGTNAKCKTQKVLPYQNRRLSMKKIKKTENKTAQKPFVSMAEAVTKFQVGTPKRFRTAVAKNEKPTALNKFATKQLTQAVSPALISKTRNRQTNVLSQVQKEELEIKKIKPNPIKANPFKALKKPNVLEKVEKRPSTIPEPFNLTKGKKGNDKTETQTLKPAASFDLGQLKKANSMTLNEIEKGQIEFKRQNVTGNTFRKLSTYKITRPKSHAGHGSTTNLKNTVPVVLRSDGQAITVQEKEVIHFGIRIGQSKITKTKAAPFSFDKRAKEFQDLQEKKQQKLKQLQEEEAKKQKVDFHAKPVPSFKRSSSTPTLNSKEQCVSKTKTTPQPFSFEQRDKMLLKKKEAIIKQAQDIDKKARLFHANPAPNFKSAPINATNFKIERKKEPVICKNQPLKAMHIPVKKVENRTAIQRDKPKFKKIVPKIELHSDKRAKERKEFDEKMKEKQRIEEEAKQKMTEVKIAKEKEAEALLRKKTEVKARPMPEFKPITVIKSNKLLTNPQSPAWNRIKDN